MPRRDRAVIDELLQVLAETGGRWRTHPLTTFAAFRGSENADQLMVIGRAVNGWTFEWNAGDAGAPEERRRILAAMVPRRLIKFIL